jgi:phosphatidylserine/phosphatidylglycerophosphate/cardiolipin synthase-like enzyme
MLFRPFLKGSRDVTGAIYHLTDAEWVVPALKSFEGKLAAIYEDQRRDQADLPAIGDLKGPHFNGFPRSKTHIMHDKFLVDRTGGRVLAGSANFTPEGLTSQANLLHIFNSAELADLYAARAKLMQDDPTIAETAKGADWSDEIKVGAAQIRVFFSPEPNKQRVSLDTVVDAVKAAKSSVIFCMFDPTDPALLKALMATSDRDKLLYGLLNSISDPSKAKKPKAERADDENRAASGLPPKNPTAATQVRVEVFNRSRKDKRVIAYNYFRPKAAPAGFLPEFSTVDLSSKSTLGQHKASGKRPPPAVHIHHKFIVIDADTEAPTIYSGSANLSKNSTNYNDENLLEIKGNPELAQAYLAEFMRLYEHYRARAIWDMGGRGRSSRSGATGSRQAFTLKTSRDGWVKQAYRQGSLDELARVSLAGGQEPAA